MIDLIISATVGGFIGFFTCAAFTLGGSMDEQFDRWDAEAEREEAKAEHARLADAMLAKQARIDRALACETPKAAHGVKKMARILRGDA